MPHANTKLFLNWVFVHSLKSWSAFWVKVQTTTISHWQIQNTENLKTRNRNVNLLSPSILARNKISYKKMTITQDHFLLSKSIWKNFEERKRRKKNPKQNKTKCRTVEKPLTGSAVNGMHFSIQVTHPCRTSKTGLESLPYSHRLRLLWSHWGCLQ